jgi:hypothetical protein
LLSWPQSAVGAGVEFEIESFDWSTRFPTPTDYPSRAAGAGENSPADGNFRWKNAIFPTLLETPVEVFDWIKQSCDVTNIKNRYLDNKTEFLPIKW